ncbi:MAG: 4Fe-4S binding protein [Fibrobacter sp.]|nr:4Fe-4S binding protein [Fibrobacter sp.]
MSVIYNYEQRNFMKRNLGLIAFTMIALLIVTCTDSIDKISVSGDTNQEMSGATVFIDANVCYGCSYENCYTRCPVKAVSRTKIGERTYFIIDPEKCIKCGICIESCPFDAITWKQ